MSSCAFHINRGFSVGAHEEDRLVLMVGMHRASIGPV